MSSPKQTEANRRNALKSTGPTTPEGKARSRCNAVRHGLTAETIIAALEDASDYQTFEAAVISDYNAETAVERELVLRLASVLWRLRRATGIETAVFDSVNDNSSSHDQTLLFKTFAGIEDRSDCDRLFLGTSNNSAPPLEEIPRSIRKKEIADCFLHLTALPTYPLDRLSRYEHTLWRQARQIVFTLDYIGRRNRHPSRPVFPFSFRANEK